MFKDIHLQNFRSYKNAKFEFSPDVTVISGPNGSGKTNLLEALYVSSRGTSFRGTDEDLLRFDSPWWRIDAGFNDETRSITYDPARQQGKKRFVINELKRQRLTSALKLPVVLFEPNDLRLLDGSPSRRRSFIDGFISQFEPAYPTHLHRYERALRQRNNLLKYPVHKKDELFVWDVTLSEQGAYITRKRFEYADLLDSRVTQQYRSVSKTKDKVQVAYHAHGGQSVKQVQHWLLTQLDARYLRDREMGFTSVGPHRDDVTVMLNGHLAGSHASRGEIRSIVLSLKLVEINELIKQADHAPLLLLDDVFSELDETRRHALVNHSSPVQTVITTTNADTLGKRLPKNYASIKL